MANTETAPTLADLARVADAASRTYDRAALRFGVNSPVTASAHADRVRAHGRLALAKFREDKRLRDGLTQAHAECKTFCARDGARVGG